MKRVEIGFGIGMDKHSNPVHYHPRLQNLIIEKATREFGGVSMWEVSGGWNSPNDGPVFEQGRIIRLDGVADDEDLQRAKDFALWVKELLQQQSIVFSVQVVGLSFI